MAVDRIACTVSRNSNGDIDGIVSSVELDLTDEKMYIHVTGVTLPDRVYEKVS